MPFDNPGQVDARDGIFQEIAGDHVTIHAPGMINIIAYGGIDDRLGRLLAAATNSNRDPHSHSISPPEPSSTISSTPLTLPEIVTVSESPESIREAPTTPSDSQTNSPISPGLTPSSSMRSGIFSSIARQISQFSGEDDSIEPATLESLIGNLLITDLSRGRLRF